MTRSRFIDKRTNNICAKLIQRKCWWVKVDKNMKFSVIFWYYYRKSSNNGRPQNLISAWSWLYVGSNILENFSISYQILNLNIKSFPLRYAFLPNLFSFDNTTNDSLNKKTKLGKDSGTIFWGFRLIVWLVMITGNEFLWQKILHFA